MNERNVIIDSNATIAPTARLRIADDSILRVAAGARIADHAEIDVAEEGVVNIGENVVIGANALLRGHGDIEIGPDSSIGPGCVLDSAPFIDDRFAFGCQRRKASIRIGARVRIGANAVIEGGVAIDDDAIVRPNSHVSCDIRGDEIAAGVPASVVEHRTVQAAPRRILFGFCRWHETAQHFVTLADTLRAANFDSRIHCTPLTASRLRYVDSDRLIVREDLRDLDEILERWSPEIVFNWSGATQLDQQVAEAARARGIECRFAELGWFPQSRTIHFDSEGTNARSSIRRLDLSRVGIDPRLDDWLERRRAEPAAPPPDITNYVFVPLQDVRDVNITLGSPYASMDAFVTALARKFSDETFVVRPHPNYSDVPLTPHPNVHVRRDLSIHPWLQHATAVIGINSTALLEALTYGRPTHAIGTGLATGLDVFYESDGVETLRIHREIDPPRGDRINRLLSELIFRRQICKKDLHYLARLESAHGIGDLLRPVSVTRSAARLTRTVATTATGV